MEQVLHEHEILLNRAGLDGSGVVSWTSTEPTDLNSAHVLVPADIGEEEEMCIHCHV